MATASTDRMRQRIRDNKLTRLFGYRDFRLLWIGAFVSFSGSWVQTVAQGYYVYRLTGDEGKLAFVSFAWSVPVLIFGLAAGSLVDILNRRVLLVAAQLLLGGIALYLAAATQFGFVRYWHIVAAAFLGGLVSSFEMPTRQSLVSRVVPPEDLAAAVPINAMTFNVARIVGPALGGLVLASLGVAMCYFLNGISFLALVWAALALRADLRAPKHEPQPLWDLIVEGMLYTFREVRLRTLFILETMTATLGLFYVPLIPAYVEQVLHFGITRTRLANGRWQEVDLAKQAIAASYTAIGLGALCGLLMITHFSDSKRKDLIIKLSMTIIGGGLVVLSCCRIPWVSYVVLAFVGGAVVMQFNTTNALFQLLSPERLRGRVLSMHIWALNGLSPFGVLFFGWLAGASRNHPQIQLSHSSLLLPLTGVALSMLIGGACVLLGAVSAWLSRQGLAKLHQVVGEK